MKFKKQNENERKVKLIADVHDGLKAKTECLDAMFKLVQTVAADHPELENDVLKAEILIQYERDSVANLYPELAKII